MFRELTRKKQEIPQEECIEILKTQLRGVLSVLGDDDYPYGMPLNHYYSEEDGIIYFHGGRKGHRTDALKRHNKASFCVYDDGIHEEGEWALIFRSVIVFGYVEFIEDRETVYRISEKLSHKFTEDDEYIKNEIKKSGPGTVLIALHPEHISGKRVTEK